MHANFLKMKRILLSLVAIALCFSIKVNAQERNTPDWKRWHYLSEEEMHTPVRNMNFVETDPPTGEPRFVAEFEPMQGVMIRYPLGIPTSLVVQLANNCHVYCIVANPIRIRCRIDPRHVVHINTGILE